MNATCASCPAYDGEARDCNIEPMPVHGLAPDDSCVQHPVRRAEYELAVHRAKARLLQEGLQPEGQPPEVSSSVGRPTPADQARDELRRMSIADLSVWANKPAYPGSYAYLAREEYERRISGDRG